MEYLIKICGITSQDDASMVLSFSDRKPEYIGFVFFEKSKRFISSQMAQEIVRDIRKKYGEKRVKCVGVFVNKNLLLPEVLEEYAFLDVFQLHGDTVFETPQFCTELRHVLEKRGDNTPKEIWKAFRIRTHHDLSDISLYSMVDTILVDALSTKKDEYGGSGNSISVDILPYIRSYILSPQKLFIAGGINTRNKNDILQISHADGIDLSSSVEISAGKKNPDKVQQILQDS